MVEHHFLGQLQLLPNWSSHLTFSPPAYSPPLLPEPYSEIMPHLRCVNICDDFSPTRQKFQTSQQDTHSPGPPGFKLPFLCSLPLCALQTAQQLSHGHACPWLQTSARATGSLTKTAFLLLSFWDLVGGGWFLFIYRDLPRILCSLGHFPTPKVNEPTSSSCSYSPFILLQLLHLFSYILATWGCV